MAATKFTEVPLAPIELGKCIGLPSNVNVFLRAQKLANEDFTQVDQQQLEQASSFGGFFPLDGHGAFSALAYKVSLSNDHLTLSPTHLIDEFKSVYTSLSFKFPDSIAFNCISLNQSHDQIFLDVLLESGILTTLVLDVESFTQNCSLLPSNVYQWCRYSMPSSLSQRKPLFMKPLDPLHTLISLADGGMLMLSRSTPFDSFSDRLFTSTSYLDSWNIFKLSKWSNNSSIPEEAEFDGNTVNTKSIIAVLPFTDDIFITLSVDKLLTFWSKSKQSIIKRYDMNQFLPDNLHSAILSPYLPQSSLRFIDNILSVFIPIGKVFVYLLDLDSNLNITLMKTLQPPVPNESWLPLDYVVTSTKPGTLEYWFTWYFGQSTMYQQCVIDQDFGVEWNSTINKSEIEDLEIQNFIIGVNGEDNIVSLNQNIMRFIKRKYPSNILLKSIELFNEHYNYEFDSMTVDEKLEIILNKNESDLQSFKKQILRFASVCQDILIKSSDNILSLYVSKNRRNQFVYILKSNGYSIIRKSTPFELLLFNHDKPTISTITGLSKTAIDDEDINIEDLLKLISLVLDFSSGFSTDAQFKIYQYLIRNNGTQSIEMTMNEIFENEIVNFVTNDVVSKLLNSLSQIDNASNLFEYLSNLFTFDPTDYKIVSGAHYSELGEFVLKESIYYNNLSATKILFGFQLILLTLDISESITHLFSKVNSHLITINMCSNVHELIEYDFMIDFIKHQCNGGVYFEGNNIDIILIKLTQLLSSDNFKYFIISNLLSKGTIAESLLVKDFWLNLPANGIGKVLRGLTLLQINEPLEAKKLFIDFSEQITKDSINITNSQRDVLEPVWETISILFVPSEIDYYYNISLIFEKMKFDQMGLFFCMKSLENVNRGIKHSISVNDILLKIFSISLRLQEYDNAYNAISQMEKRDRSTPLRMFVYNLFQEGQLKRLLDFDFGEDFIVVDDLIWGMGEESIGMVNEFENDVSLINNSSGIIDCKLSLKYYRICYALRLKRNDLRSGAEALNRFNSIIISRLPKVGEGCKLEKSMEIGMVLDNYLIISNLLQTIENADDRWIIRKCIGKEERNSLLSFDDLQRQWKLLEISLIV